MRALTRLPLGEPTAPHTQDMSAKEVFRQFDSTGRGLLDASGLMSLFAVLLPALRETELEALVAKWKAMSFSEVQKAMQWVTVKRAKAQKRLLDGGELPSFSSLSSSSSTTAAAATTAASTSTVPPASAGACECANRHFISS